MRHAGVGWSNGPVDNAAVLALPSPDLLMLSPEARWHHDEAVRANKRVVWRAVPRVGKRPAELGWSPSRFVDECLNLTDAPDEPIRDFIWANELDLNYERGDLEDDFHGLEQRYTLIGGWAYSVVSGLRAALPGTRLHWPAWTPDHDALMWLPRWKAAADLCDVIDFHAYDSLANIQNAYQDYRQAFPHKPLMLTEWHCRGDLVEERRVLEWLADTMAADPLFEAAHFFIWAWHNAPGWWSDDWDVEHNPARLDLFMHPPTMSTPVPEPIVEPEPAPMPTPKSREQVIEISNRVADEAGIPRLLLLACGVAESNLRWDARRPTDPAQDAAYWTDVSHGVWQQTVRWSQEYKDWYTHDAPGHPPAQFPGVDVTEAAGSHYYDVEHAARVAARQLKAHYRPNEVDAIAKALARYNKPALDGKFASPAHEANYRRGINEAAAILGEAPVPAPPPSGETVYEQYPDPQPAGVLTRCEGVIFHGSRSGKSGNPLDAEYKGTATYEVNNPLGLGWNATVGPGKVALHLDARHWGWNARKASDKYVGVEIAQPTVNDPLPDSVATALADYIFDHVWPVWGELWHFPSHSELEVWGETGQLDGKSDLYLAGDERMNVFRQKVYDRLHARKGDVPAPEPVPEPTPEPEPAPEPSRLSVLLDEMQERLDEIRRLAS